MPEWEVTLSDGRTVIVDAPTQPTPEQVQQQINQLSPEQIAAMSTPEASATRWQPGAVPPPSAYEQPLSRMERTAATLTDPDTAINALPAIGGTVGGIAGAVGGGVLGGAAGAPAGGVGAVPGASAGVVAGRIGGSAGGAGLGEWLRQKIQRARGQEVPEGTGEIVKEAALSGGIDALFPGAKAIGRGLYGAAVRNMPDNLLTQAPQLIARGLAERIPVSWRGAQQAGGRVAALGQEAIDKGTPQRIRNARGQMTKQMGVKPDPATLASQAEMASVKEMVEGSARAAQKPPRPSGGGLGSVINRPGAQTAISMTMGGPVVGGAAATIELLQALRNNPAALARLGITADQIAPLLQNRAVTEGLRYWETLKTLGQPNGEPGAR